MCVGSWVPTSGGRSWSTFDKKTHFLLPSRCPVTNIFKLESSSQYFQEPGVCGWQQCHHHVSIQTSKQSLSCLSPDFELHIKIGRTYSGFYIFPQHFCQCVTDLRFKEADGCLSYKSSFTWSCLQVTSVMFLHPAWSRGFQDLLHLLIWENWEWKQCSSAADNAFRSSLMPESFFLISQFECWMALGIKHVS